MGGGKSFLKIRLDIPKNFHIDIGNKDLASYGAGHPEKFNKGKKGANFGQEHNYMPKFTDFGYFSNFLG